MPRRQAMAVQGEKFSTKTVMRAGMRWLVAIFSLFVFVTSFAPARAAEIVDLELALAVDASGSVDDGEYRLQIEGIAAGFRDKAVKEAIRSGPLKRIAVAVIIWAEPQVPKDTTGWVMISTDAEAEAFASEVEGMERHMNGATGIGEGVSWSLRSMEEND